MSPASTSSLWHDYDCYLFARILDGEKSAARITKAIETWFNEREAEKGKDFAEMALVALATSYVAAYQNRPRTIDLD